MGSTEPLLSVRDLVTTFRTERGEVRAVDRVSFDVARGETLGLVGESGCGKSVTALSIMRLVASPPGRIASGRVLLEGKDLLALEEPDMQRVRGGLVSMIFQEPMTSLNPVYTVGAQIIEAIRIHRDVSRREARDRTIELLKLVGIPSPESNIDAYPHQLSGGMRQRVMIAMALSCDPKVLVADEPTTALDVTIQAQILDLLRKLQEKMNMAVLLITHDLGVIAEVAKRVVVMYAGRVVERGTVKDIFRSPRHPYTKGLLDSMPKPLSAEDRQAGAPRRRLPTIEGVVPDLHALPKGCVFQDRCGLVEPACREAEPDLVVTPDGGDDHESRCFRHEVLAQATRGEA